MALHHSAPESAASASQDRRDLLLAQRRQILGLLMLLVGLALFAAPFVGNHPDTAKDIHRNELVVGLVVVFTAGSRFRWEPGRRSDVIIFLCGAWLAPSPWLLGLQDTQVFDGSHVFDLVAGIVLMVLAVLSLLLLAAAERAGAPRAGEAARSGGGR